jgi:FkbM family methyltransferase
MNNFGLVVIGAHNGSGLENEVLKTSKKILFVEPVKYNFSELQDRYKNLNNIYFDNSAVSNNNDKLNFFYVKKNSVEKLGKHWATGIGSFSKKHILDHKSKRFQISDNDIDVNEITPLTFDQLMTKYDINIIDKLLIDIEGSEKKIIESIDFKKTLILELTFEYKHLDDTFVFNNSLKIMTNYLSDRNFKEINRDKENITFKNSQ